jgi:hypothetical protein
VVVRASQPPASPGLVRPRGCHLAPIAAGAFLDIMNPAANARGPGMAPPIAYVSTTLRPTELVRPGRHSDAQEAAYTPRPGVAESREVIFQWAESMTPPDRSWGHRGCRGRLD